MSPVGNTPIRPIALRIDGTTRIVHLKLEAANPCGSLKDRTALSLIVSLRRAAVGRVIVAANGRTFYLSTADKTQKSVCYGKCAGYWPALIAAKPTLGTGLKTSLLGTTKRRVGKLQVTYGGHPLYFFALDIKAADLKGQGYASFGGSWWAVSAAGKAVKTEP